MLLTLPRIDKVVLLGGGRLLLSLARWCQTAGIPIQVVTSPRHSDEVVEPGHSLRDALDLEGIALLVIDKLDSKTLQVELGDLRRAFCLSLGAAWIFPPEMLNNLFHGRLLNLHGTRLPQNRGGGGLSWRIMMGSRLGFCQLHLVDEGVDSGDLVLTEEFLYPASCRTPKDYENESMNRNLRFVSELIETLRLDSVSVETRPQAHYLSTYFPRLNSEEHAWIDWGEELTTLERFVLAFDEPYSGAKTSWRGKTVALKSVMADYSDSAFHPFQSGLVYRNNGKWLSVCANGGSLIVEKVEGKNGLDLISQIDVGDRFVTESTDLARRTSRVFYLPSGKKYLSP